MPQYNKVVISSSDNFIFVVHYEVEEKNATGLTICMNGAIVDKKVQSFICQSCEYDDVLIK